MNHNNNTFSTKVIKSSYNDSSRQSWGLIEWDLFEISFYIRILMLKEIMNISQNIIVIHFKIKIKK